MAKTDTTAELRKVPLFAGLDKHELEMVSRLLKEQRYEKGAVIVKNGATGQGLFIIKEGSVSVKRDGHTVSQMGPGDFFGEIAVLDGGPRTADVQADTDTVCLTMVSWDIKPLLMEHATISYKMLQQMIRRLREARPYAD